MTVSLTWMANISLVIIPHMLMAFSGIIGKSITIPSRSQGWSYAREGISYKIQPRVVAAFIPPRSFVCNCTATWMVIIVLILCWKVHSIVNGQAVPSISWIVLYIQLVFSGGVQDSKCGVLGISLPSFEISKIHSHCCISRLSEPMYLVESQPEFST